MGTSGVLALATLLVIALVPVCQADTCMNCCNQWGAGSPTTDPVGSWTHNVQVDGGVQTCTYTQYVTTGVVQAKACSKLRAPEDCPECGVIYPNVRQCTVYKPSCTKVNHTICGPNPRAHWGSATRCCQPCGHLSAATH